MATQINETKLDEKDAITQVLLQKEIISAEVFEKIKKQADHFKQNLFEHLLQYQYIAADAFQKACADFFKLPEAILDNQYALSDFIIPDETIEQYFLLPIEKNNETLTIVIANPNDIGIAKKIAFKTGLTVKLQFVKYDILCQLHNLYISKKIYRATDQTNTAQKIAHQLLSDAMHRNASDIHIEPYQYDLRIRFRIDGLLHETTRFSNTLSDAIISCIKVLSGLDIAIKRTPQDGRLAFRSYLGFFKDCRVSTCPTIHGEKIVIRLLDAHTQIRAISELGLTATDQKSILQVAKQPQGLILITGPTGSGKTITLYTLLNLLNDEHRNIATVEDPAEIQIEGVNQTTVNIKTGLNFSQSLRTLLRQDPDVMMIGEIRDQETAQIAIRAAQTGHLVLSTLHTNSAAEAINRLLHMGIPPFQLSSAITLIIAQRLVRKLCVHCKKIIHYSEKTLAEANIKTHTPLFSENGCQYCTNGFSGRLGVFEIMPVNQSIHQLILNSASHIALSRQNKLNGHSTLWEAGIDAIKNGTTSLNEIYRVIAQGT